jgi:UDP-N-acetylglucosamine 1-carboxyvinyltransferase
VMTDTHPGFMTDWQAPLVVLFTQVDGMSVVHETVFENRFTYVHALKAMGAEIEVFDACLGGRDCRFHEMNERHSAVVHGPTRLQGAEITVPDIRGGFAYLIGAAAGDGTTILHDIHHIERGFHKAFDSLTDLGLKVERL